MSNLARKIQEQRNHEQQNETSVQTVVRHKARITVGEKILMVAFALVMTVLAATIVSNQYAIYEANKDIQIVESSISDQNKVNNDLKVEVSELSTYERIWQKASELGLKLNENNVKVVQK
ncbi:cell division protein FtsL [Peribacillus alkalitolerans]|uniref:cell division protein FtsL n=1 Tax=Peribacillus alkalitolerans TaxID=1550385 RepID=UPI0013D299DA|nr:cell division protein FtsL [Peribacillus alkalitolerans]